MKRNRVGLRILVGILMTIGGLVVMIMQLTTAYSASPFADPQELQVVFWCLQFPLAGTLIIGGMILIFKRK